MLPYWPTTNPCGFMRDGRGVVHRLPRTHYSEQVGEVITSTSVPSTTPSLDQRVQAVKAAISEERLTDGSLKLHGSENPDVTLTH